MRALKVSEEKISAVLSKLVSGDGTDGTDDPLFDQLFERFSEMKDFYMEGSQTPAFNLFCSEIKGEMKGPSKYLRWDGLSSAERKTWEIKAHGENPIVIRRLTHDVDGEEPFIVGISLGTYRVRGNADSDTEEVAVEDYLESIMQKNKKAQ